LEKPLRLAAEIHENVVAVNPDHPPLANAGRPDRRRRSRLLRIEDLTETLIAQCVLDLLLQLLIALALLGLVLLVLRFVFLGHAESLRVL
jgi:hypothetical protein